MPHTRNVGETRIIERGADGASRLDARRRLRFAAAALVAGLSSHAACEAETAPAKCDRIDVPPATLADSLDALARQADVDLLFAAEDVAPYAAAGVADACSVKDALDALLDGTGLIYSIGADGVVIVGARARPASGRAARIAPEQLSAGAAVAAPAEAPAADAARGNDDEVVVTGTFVRGEGPVGAPLIVLDRAEFQQRGAGTVQDALAGLPQNLGAGPNEATAGIGGTAEAGANLNFAFGSSVNLRGLGPDKTLTLVNGRRLAPAGADGGFADLSLIPLTAVDRIEALTDGASALYGSDAVGGVVNIILRTDYEGAETRARFGAVTKGGFDERRVGQTAGVRWDSGSTLIAYEYFSQDFLLAADRDFAATSDLRAFGGDNFDLQGFGNPGTLIAGGQSFALPAGEDGAAIDPALLVAGTANATNRREGTSLFPKQRRHSAFATLTERVGDRVELFLEGSYSSRKFDARGGVDLANLVTPASNPFFVDPVGGQPFVIVQYNFGRDFGPSRNSGRAEAHSAAGGARWDVGAGWRLDFSLSEAAQSSTRKAEGLANRPALALALADPDPSTAFNPFGDGSNTSPATLAAIAGFVETSTGSSVRTAMIKADGPLFDLPGGEVKLAVGGEFRRDGFDFERIDFQEFAVPTSSAPVDLDRRVFAAFGELVAPIVGDANARPGVKALDLSAAVRFERYSDFGGTANPKFGARYEPVDGVSFRATYGKSFRAPLLTEINPEDFQIFAGPFPDPASPTGFSTVMFLLGANPDLEPEKARTLSAGVDLNPGFAPGLHASAGYFSIDLKNRIDTLDVFTALFREAEFAAAITRNPDPMVAQALLDNPVANDFGLGLVGADIDIILDGRVNNTARTKIRGIDASLNYAFDLGEAGSGAIGFTGSYVIDFIEAFSPTAPFVETVDTLGRQPDFRGRGELSWSKDAVSAALFVNYTDSYSDDVSVPSRKIGAWTTADLTVGLDLGALGGGDWLEGLRASASAVNIFDEDPPFANNPNGAGFDPNNANPRGRFISIELTKAW